MYRFCPTARYTLSDKKDDLPLHCPPASAAPPPAPTSPRTLSPTTSDPINGSHRDLVKAPAAAAIAPGSISKPPRGRCALSPARSCNVRPSNTTAFAAPPPPGARTEAGTWPGARPLLKEHCNAETDAGLLQRLAVGPALALEGARELEPQLVSGEASASSSPGVDSRVLEPNLVREGGDRAFERGLRAWPPCCGSCSVVHAKSTRTMAAALAILKFNQNLVGGGAFQSWWMADRGGPF
ncbi:hypothetical protein T492DRAFT_849695 [Pavlovales sp. CCMP2436]|nr:hypothetical protein T492DRAFT_849695 [Pavlovales sp. CCMP2436]